MTDLNAEKKLDRVPFKMPEWAVSDLPKIKITRQYDSKIWPVPEGKCTPIIYDATTLDVLCFGEPEDSPSKAHDWFEGMCLMLCGVGGSAL